MNTFRSECLVLLLLMLPLLAVCTVGCSSPTGPAPGDTQAQHDFWTTQPADVREETLRQDLARTCPAANPLEVAAVAAVAVRYGERLREEYDLSRPVEWNNLLIRWGIKERGLCFELADDLFCRLRAMRLETLDLHQGRASVGDLIYEHNCVIVTDRGRPFKTGTVLDLWRYAGKLRWMAVAEDHHPWEKRETLPPPAELIVGDWSAHAKSIPVPMSPATPADVRASRVDLDRSFTVTRQAALEQPDRSVVYGR